jgi:hypothetical protein
MQRFEQLQLEDGTILRDSRPIEKYLYTSPFYWLLECELDGVKIKIKDGVLYWQSGVLYWGNWRWGVFEGGSFRSGTWHGGIFTGGTFSARWLNGVFRSGDFRGDRVGGKFPDELIA